MEIENTIEFGFNSEEDLKELNDWFYGLDKLSKSPQPNTPESLEPKLIQHEPIHHEPVDHESMDHEPMIVDEQE